MVREGGAVGDYLRWVPLQWFLLTVFVPDSPDFQHDPLAGQIIEVALPTFVGCTLIVSCWRLFGTSEASATRASVASLFVVAGFLGLLALGPASSGRFVWQVPLNIALGAYLAVLGVRELSRLRRLRDVAHRENPAIASAN